MKCLFETGMSALEVIAEIAGKNSRIGRMQFLYYSPSTNLKDRIDAGKEISVEESIRHSPNPEDYFWMERNSVRPGSLLYLVEKLQEERCLGISSLVLECGSKRKKHIPMLDFACPVTKENLRNIMLFLHRMTQLGLIGEKGAILDSGRSFHFYGTELVSLEKLRIFWAYAILFASYNGSYSDCRYIAHRTIDGNATLRISGWDRNSQPPKVVGIYDTERGRF